jgi:SAM-dependent methyltransferase
MQEWNGTVDVVSAIEVLEHVADPYPILDRIAQLLRPGGILLLTTGNVACHRGPLERWSYVMPEVHITFYSPSSLDVAYRKVGLLPIAARRSTGWDGVIRYKVLKNLGIHRRGLLEQLLPWAPIGWFLDRRRGVSAMLSARKAP